jgi:hypothetical protein
VPTKKPARVSRSSAFWSAAAAMPKSSSFTSPLAGSYITFSGFRSRCTIPASCAGLHRAGDLPMIFPTSATGSGLLRLAYFSRISPPAHSMARKCSPGSPSASGASPISMVRTTLGWITRPP